MKKLNKQVYSVLSVDKRGLTLGDCQTVAEFRGKLMLLQCGKADDVDFYQEDDCIYVLSRNYSFEYIGLEVHDKETLKEIASIFLQGGEEIDEVLGKNGIDRSAHHTVKLLKEYCYD